MTERAGPEQTGPAAFGRVDSDGTVYVRTSVGERVVGQVPGVPADEAWASLPADSRRWSSRSRCWSDVLPPARFLLTMPSARSTSCALQSPRPEPSVIWTDCRIAWRRWLR
jgi:hypothetical protein